MGGGSGEIRIAFAIENTKVLVGGWFFLGERSEVSESLESWLVKC